MGCHGFGFELRVELAAEEPGVILELDHLDELAVRAHARHLQPGLLSPGAPFF